MDGYSNVPAAASGGGRDDRDVLLALAEEQAVVVPLGDISASVRRKVYLARSPRRVLDVGLLVDADVARHASNYWECIFRRRGRRVYGTAWADSVLSETVLRSFGLDELSGVTAVDRSGNQNGTHLSPNGPTLLGPGFPNADAEIGVTYDGVNDFTDLGPATLALDNAMGFETAFKPAALDVAQTIIGNGDVADTPRLAVDASGKVIVAIDDTVIVQETGSGLLRLNEPNLIDYVRSAAGNNHQLHVNGFVAPITTASQDFVDTAATWSLGRRAAGSEFLRGALDEVAIFGAPPSVDRIRDRMSTLGWKSSKLSGGSYDAEGFTEGAMWSLAACLREANLELAAGEQIVVDLAKFGAAADLKGAAAYVVTEAIA